MSKMGFISIHAPLAGRDGWKHRYPRKADRFQSTRPLRGATSLIKGFHVTVGISIHAPLAGRDARHIQRFARAFYFNPRAPCGARLSKNTQRPCGRRYFNPRAPCGARPMYGGRARQPEDFNPRAPCGARRDFDHHHHGAVLISIHAPLAGRDAAGRPRAAAS